MYLRELLTDRYAVLHNLSPRTVVLMAQTLDRWAEQLGHDPTVDDLTDLSVSRFVRWRSTTPHRGRLASPATVRKDMAHIVALANHAARKRAARGDGSVVEFLDLPRNLVRVPTRPPRGYTVDEVSAIIRAGKRCRGHIGPVPAAWLWMTLPWAAWLTGERRGALLRLRWGEVDLELCRLTFLGATRKDRITTIQRDITPALRDFLRPQVRKASDLVWPWLDHRNENSIHFGIIRVCKAAGVPCRGFHGFRKSSGSYVAAAGGDATDHLGHANSRTTKQHYLDVGIVGRQSALDFLPPLDLR
jgi:integrase